MRAKGTLFQVIMAAVFAVPCIGLAQSQQQPLLYVSVDCMKSTSPDYTSVEVDVWKSMHQELVRQGKRNSWALYSVLYGDRSKCDHYTVTTYRGEEQLNSDPDYAEVFGAVHAGKNLAKAMDRTWASRQHVATELWVQVDGTDIRPHRYAVINRMYAEDPDAYERMESRVFKAGHEELLEAGHRSGWAMYTLVSPTGTSIPYNYSTVDFSNHLSPVPMAEAMLTAHPDRDLDALQELLELREHVSSETWVLVAATEPVPDEE